MYPTRVSDLLETNRNDVMAVCGSAFCSFYIYEMICVSNQDSLPTSGVTLLSRLSLSGSCCLRRSLDMRSLGARPFSFFRTAGLVEGAPEPELLELRRGDEDAFLLRLAGGERLRLAEALRRLRLGDGERRLGGDLRRLSVPRRRL